MANVKPPAKATASVALALLLSQCLWVAAEGRSMWQLEGRHEEDRSLVRARRWQHHSGRLSRLADNLRASLERAVLGLDLNWSEGADEDRRIVDVGEARIDRLASSRNRDIDRYSARYGDHVHGAVHIERGYRIGSGLIRESFLQSIEQQAHVFLTRPDRRHIVWPDDGLEYSHRDIVRRWDGRDHVVRVWSTRPVLDHLERRFHGRDYF